MHFQIINFFYFREVSVEFPQKYRLFTVCTITVALVVIGLQNFAQIVDSKYWQQEVNSTIEVRLDDSQHELNATIEIEYINHSPDTLTFIWFHLWPNAYANRKTALAKQQVENGSIEMYFAAKEHLGGITGLSFAVNEKPVGWAYDLEHIDICKIYLNEPLFPGDTIFISTPFKVKLPASFSRLGHVGESYQITQWFPKPAVYDRDGWHPMPYLDQGEFYSEYGSYDVRISLPVNYLVAATGDLQNEAERKWLLERATATLEIDTFGFDTSFPPSSDSMKTLRYMQDRVHDFAWFADKRWHVLAGEVELPHSGRKVETWSFFTNYEATLWKKSLEYLRDGTYYYSLWNGDYPYNQVTAVEGALSAGGGMEYPTITIIGEAGSAFALEEVIVHEVGHNWFYGILGSDEREDAWMDEGINTFNEIRYFEKKYPERKMLGKRAEKGLFKMLNLDYQLNRQKYELLYLFNAVVNEDQACQTHSEEFTMMNYGTIAYSKTGLLFDYLLAYLGDSLFDRCMQTYFDAWKFKHPAPADLEKIFEETTGENLDWFFNDLIKTNKKVDYKICKVKKNQGEETGTSIKIKNKGQANSPFSISESDGDSVITTKWFGGFEGQKILTVSDFGVFKSNHTFRIDGTLDMPEINRENNNYKLTGPLPKMEKLRFQFLGSVTNPNRSQVFYTPAYGFNKHDGHMVGLALYNHTIPFRRFEFTVMPLYAFGSKTVTGVGNITFNQHPREGKIQHLKYSIAVRRFSWLDNPTFYNRIVPEVSFYFKKKRPRSPVTKRFSVKHTSVVLNWQEVAPGDDSMMVKRTRDFHVPELIFEITNSKTINPRSFKIER